MSLPRRPLVVLTDSSIHREAVERLHRDCSLRILQDYPGERELMLACGDADALLVRLAVITAPVIEAAPRLRIIAKHGAGSDGVDLPAATARGIVVTTTGSANAGAVAEYTIALLLGLLRKIPAADSGMRTGGWSRPPLVGMGLEGRTMGIVGCGAVGSRLARIATAFGMTVFAAASLRGDPAPKPVPVLPLRALLSRSDIVCLTARLTLETYGIIDAVALAAMKPTAVLVNTARGGLIDEPALIAALRCGALAGAALDTYATEPLPPDSELRHMANVLLSPHVAGQTHDAVLRVAICAAQAILDEFAGRRPPFVVNPEAYAMRERIVAAGTTA